MDATSGYYQIPIAEKDKQKTAFSWKNNLYEFNRMPFGLCNAPSTFQRAMNSILKGKFQDFVFPYLDDIIVFSKTVEEHEKHLILVMNKLKAANLILNQSKCKFFRKEVKILGHIVKEGTVSMDPEKVRALREYKRPESVKELRSFMGLANYCRDYIPRFAETTKPLFDVFKGESKRSEKKIIWDQGKLEAYKFTKKSIEMNTERAQPNFREKFILITDASSYAISAILAQKDAQGKEKMIYAYSKGLDKAQINYSVTDKELLAVVKGIEHFRHFLLGSEFILRTDHKALEYLWSTNNQEGRLMRWALKLQEYKFTPEYIKGEKNAADGLSRYVNSLQQINENSCEPSNPGTKQRILEEYHLNLGHGSMDNMKFAIKQKYNWPKMTKDIESFVKKCKICSRSGGEKINTKNKIITSKKPNEIWVCDLLGRIPIRGQSFFILVCVDHFSKWVETKFLNSKNSKEVTQAIKEIIIDKHGIPETIYTDCGLEFLNADAKDLADKNCFKWTYSSPHHHESVGLAERTNKTLLEKLKKLTDFGRKSIKEALPRATLALNMSFNRAIQTSSFIFKYGRTPMFEIDKNLNAQEKIIPVQNSVEMRNSKFKEYAKKNIEKGKISIERNLKVGDPVLIFRPLLSNKLGAEWQPGYKIRNLIGSDAYEVEKDKSTIRVNKKHIKLDYK